MTKKYCHNCDHWCKFIPNEGICLCHFEDDEDHEKIQMTYSVDCCKHWKGKVNNNE